MPPLTLHYHLTYSQFREAARALARLHPHGTLGILGITALALTSALLATLAGAFIYALLHSAWTIHPVAATLFIALTIVLLLYIPLAACASLTRHRRAWNANRHLADPHTLTVTDTTLTESWDTGQHQFTWTDIRQTLETPNALLLILPYGFLIIPNAATPPDAFQTLLTLVRSHTGAAPRSFPAHAFPLDPSPTDPPS
jgi:hypothetical protein